MEVITVESKVFQELSTRLNQIESQINGISDFILQVTNEPHFKGENDWISNAELARVLGISERTLLRLRKDNMISYMECRGRIKYKISDVDKALKDLVINCDPSTIEEFRKNFLIKKK